MKVVGYARTSWQEQIRSGFASVEDQECALREFAQQVGLALDKVYSDCGLSPKQSTCAGMINILDSMGDDWDAVLVIAPCRLKGNATLSFDPLPELRQNKKRILVANKETAKALSSVLKQLRSKQAAAAAARKTDQVQRRREIAERLLRGREAGAKAGKHQSGPAPFGYRRDYSRRATEGVLLVPETEEAEVVKLIFKEYLRLRSMKRLIKLLDEQGLRTRRGKRWSRAGVSWILKNDTYVGRVHFGNIRVKGRHEAIIAPILFNKVQKLIRTNNKRNRKGNAKPQPPPIEEEPAPEVSTPPEETSHSKKSRSGGRRRVAPEPAPV